MGSAEKECKNSCFFGLGDHGGSGGLDDGGVETAKSVDDGVLGLGEGGGAHEKPVGLCGFEIDGGNEGHGVESGMERRGRAHGGNSDSLIIEEHITLGLNSDAVGRVAGDGVAEDKVAHLMIGDFYSLKGGDIEGVPVDIPGKLHVDV